MKWPGVLSTATRIARSSPLGALMVRIDGISPGDGSGAPIGEREMRRIRAKQIDAVTRLVPVTMTVNLANVAIILFVF